MSRAAYDAGVLVAADRRDRRVWLKHRVRLMEKIVPLVPAPVVAQVRRSPRQALLRRFLARCHIAPMGEREAHEAGRLLGQSRTADVVDASLIRTRIGDVGVLACQTILQMLIGSRR